MTIRTIAALAASSALTLAACATPTLDVAEPSTEQHVEARASLSDVVLEPAPRTAEWRNDIGFWHVANNVRRGTRTVCQNAGQDASLCERANFAHVTLVRDPAVNAIATAEGNIGFYTGLVDVLGSEAEVAAILSHEFAHVVLAHVDAAVQNQVTGYLVGAFLGGALAGALGVDPQGLTDSFMQAGSEIGAVSYSREMEIEADRMAVYILHAAGYAPEAMRNAIVRTHRHFHHGRADGSLDTPVGFFETHPRDDRRIAHIMAAVRDVEAGVPLAGGEPQQDTSEIGPEWVPVDYDPFAEPATADAEGVRE